VQTVPQLRSYFSSDLIPVVEHQQSNFASLDGTSAVDWIPIVILIVGHIVVPTHAVRDEGTSYHYLPPGREVAASPEGVAAIEAALQEGGGRGELETSAELDLVPHEPGGYRIPSMRLEIVVAGGGSQEKLDAALGRAMEMCPICNALTGTNIRVTTRPA